MATPVKPRRWSPIANDLALKFLAFVADEDKGRTRVGAALRAVNFIRKLIGVQDLSNDPRVALLREGVLRLQPHAPSGAVSFPVKLLVAIAQRWGSSSTWLVEAHDCNRNDRRVSGSAPRCWCFVRP